MLQTTGGESQGKILLTLRFVCFVTYIGFILNCIGLLPASVPSTSHNIKNVIIFIYFIKFRNFIYSKLLFFLWMILSLEVHWLSKGFPTHLISQCLPDRRTYSVHQIHLNYRKHTTTKEKQHLRRLHEHNACVHPSLSSSLF